MLDRTTLEFVACIVDKMDADLFAKEMLKLGYYYNQAYMATEINGHGEVVNRRFSEHQGGTVFNAYTKPYPRLYFREVFDDLKNKISFKAGWKTTKVSRPGLIDDFAEFTRDVKIKVYCEDLINEMYSFISKKGKMEAEEGALDDRIFGAAIALRVHQKCPMLKAPEQPLSEPKSEMERRLRDFQKKLADQSRMRRGYEDPHLGTEF